MSFSDTPVLMETYDIPYEISMRKMLNHHITVSSDLLKRLLHDIIFIHISQILSAVGLMQTLVTTSKYLHSKMHIHSIYKIHKWSKYKIGTRTT